VVKVAPSRIALILAAALAAAPGARSALWVSPGGDDANPGTEEQPLRTVGRARDIVRTLNANMSDDITVFIGGTHRLTRPLEFGPEDSGTNGFSVVYTAAPGERPVLSGGLPVDGWTLADPARNLWSAPAPEGLADTRDLFVNGSPAIRTRTRLYHTLPESQEDASKPDPWALWKNPADVELISSAPDAIWSERAGAPPYYGENALELLATPGQWYFDRSARRIYYMPRAGENLTAARVVAASASALVVGEGTRERPLLGLIFKGIRFEYSTAAGALATAAAGPPAAVRLAYAGDIQFLEDEFVHMGTPALDLGPGVAGGTVEACLFGDLSWQALRITESARIRVASSRFSYVSTGHPEQAAIEVSWSRDVAIGQCQIDHFPRAAIAETSSGPGTVVDEGNQVAPPLIYRETGKVPAAGSGIPPAYQGLLDEKLSAPAAPHPPANVAADPRDKSAIVAWDPPCLDGGSPVVSYEVAASTGARITVPASDFRAKGYAVFPGLENGPPVSFTVAAVNALGASAPSVACAPVVPAHRRRQKPPPAPAQATVSAGDGGAKITIAAPATDGGSPIVAYSLDALPAGAHLLIEGRDVIHSDATHPVERVVDGFAPPSGTEVAVSAVNGAGQGKPAVVRWP
jgi:hypothetical protein